MRIAGEPEPGAGQRLRRGQPSEEAAVARHVRLARAADVQHRSVVAVPHGVPIGVGSAVRRPAVRAGRRGHREMEIETDRKQTTPRRQRQRDGDVRASTVSALRWQSAAWLRRPYGSAAGRGGRVVQLAGHVARVGQRPGLAPARRLGG